MSSTSFKRNRSAASRRLGAKSNSSGRGSARRARATDDAATLSSGNVFSDLGRADADELQAKAELSLLLTRIIHRRGLSQRAAATVLGISPPDVSDLMRGKLARFSYERLIRFLVRGDANVAIVVSPPGDGRRPARLTVREVARP